MWFLAGSQAVDQPICCCGARLRVHQSSGFGLGSRRRAGHFGTESHVARVRCLAVGGAASLCSRCAPTRGFRCGRPTGVSGVGGQPGIQVWAPSPLICVQATGLQVSARAVYGAFTIQGLRGDGCQSLWLLQRVL